MKTPGSSPVVVDKGTLEWTLIYSKTRLAFKVNPGAPQASH